MKILLKCWPWNGITLTGGLGFDELSNSMDRAKQASNLLLTKTK